MKTVSRIALVSAVLLALSACGNKGPLVLPERPTPVQQPTPAPKTQTGAPPVQVKPQEPTSAPSPQDDAATQAIDQGSGNGKP
ncbi:LPS translocon maturation chaperone LptM [Pseudoxanthomonas winnipegensis]|uniref:LPS translocon maturation chaperone LptM n=1 Tax=Pseudoxanthomonas winnipegensis TaxID=2480810 RepID=UPI003F8765D0